MFLYLSKWKWFVLSLAVCIGVAVVYLLRTPSVYTRTATLLIEDNDKGGSISASEMSFADLGLFQSNTNVNNEIIAMSSPALMQDVVRRLHLDMTYSADGRFHDEVLYGSTLPVTVALNEFTDGESASLTMYVDTSGAVSLYDFRTVLNGENVRYKDVVQGKVGEMVETPLGGIVVNPTAFFHRVGSGMEITVSKSTLYGATTAYSSKLTVSLLQKEATVVSLSMKDVSVQRAVDVLNTLISAYNESWVSAKNQIAVSTSAFIDDRLRVIEHELGAVEEDISQEYPNDQLEAERMWNYEIAYSQRLLDGRLTYGVNLFYIDADNLIVSQMVDGRRQNVNTGEARNAGVEAQAAWRINATWSVDGNYSYLYMANPIVAAPEHKLYVGGTFSKGICRLSTGVQYVAGLYPKSVIRNFCEQNVRQ